MSDSIIVSDLLFFLFLLDPPLFERERFRSTSMASDDSYTPSKDCLVPCRQSGNTPLPCWVFWRLKQECLLQYLFYAFIFFLRFLVWRFLIHAFFFSSKRVKHFFFLLGFVSLIEVEKNSRMPPPFHVLSRFFITQRYRGGFCFFRHEEIQLRPIDEIDGKRRNIFFGSEKP